MLRKGTKARGRGENGAAVTSFAVEADGAGALPALESAAPNWEPLPVQHEEPPLAPETREVAPASASAGARPHGRFTKKRAALVLLACLVLFMGAVYSQKDKISPKVADTSRNLIGDERTARIESWFFALQDRVDRVKYRIVGGQTNPFAAEVHVELLPMAKGRTVVYYLGDGSRPPESQLTADTLGPVPMQLPKTIALRDSLEAGEGAWTTAGLPRSTPDDMLMAKTFIRPDRSRPYAMVGVLLVDARRIRLHMTAGVGDPGGFRGVKGPGVMPQDGISNLLAAWNGGFKGAHGSYGMYADGTEYVPLRNGLATMCVMKDGSLKMGEWGADIAWDASMSACRQNAVLLVQNGEVSKRTTEGNDTWGYVQVNSSEFITWRSAVGLTKDGNLLYAAGNSLSAEALAKALWAAGAYTAMQLDINSPYVLLGTFFPQSDGSVRSERFMDNMPDSPTRFLRSQDRDFMWVTLDETRYR